jgi:hypothetical protein
VRQAILFKLEYKVHKQLNKKLVIFAVKLKIMLTLNEQHLTDLKAFINKIPTEFGLPLLTFFGQLEQEQKPKEEPKTED